MSKVNINVRVWQSVKLEVNGIELLVYENGMIKRYFERAVGGYSKGWNVLTGRVGRNGYRSVGANGKYYQWHRLVYKAFNQQWDISDTKQMIDHIDGNPLNNKLSNLRLATNSQNQQNKGTQKNSRTGEKCISPFYYKQRDIWFWRIQIEYTENGQRKRYQKKTKAGDGRIPEVLPEIPQDFIDLRDRMLIELHGDYSNNGR